MVVKRKRKSKYKDAPHVVKKVEEKKKHDDDDDDDDEQQGTAENGSEDYCFVCKDGGLLIVCDHNACVKAYHTDCVGQEEASEDTEVKWFCEWHNCFMCKKPSRYQCFCCPKAFCQSCLKDASFAKVRGSKGFCGDCLNIALLGEEGHEVDSDGERVDFKDRETYEGLFKEYWDIIKEKEGLTLEDLHHADIQIKKGDNVKVLPQKGESDSDVSVKEEETKNCSSDDHDSDDAVEPVIVINNEKPKSKKAAKKKKGSSRLEYIGWASKPLIEFLESIAVDTSKKLSQDDVALHISKYVHENKLFHPEKRKTVVCDARLRSLVKRKTISIYKINDSLDIHLQENLDQSDGDGYSTGYEEDNSPLPAKKQAWWRNVGSFQHKGSLMEKYHRKEPTVEEPNKTEIAVKVVYSRFATIAPQNLKLVYLKKSLVENLLKQYETDTFEGKVTGSFVKIKSQPFDPKHPYQLLPVTGITKAPGDETKEVLLQVSDLFNGVPIRLLSNDDISEEDCEDLRQKIEIGVIPKPTVVELERKAKELHEDITKYAIDRELSVLKHRIDLANEKGHRAELFDYRKRRELLQSEQEQSRLLNELPRVIADVEAKPDPEEPENDGSPNNEKSKNDKTDTA